MAAALREGSGEITLTWSGTAVDAGRLESELVRLRYRAAGQPPEGEGFAIRSSLLNMVVYADNRQAAREASGAIAALAGHHPSRALIIIARPSSGESRIDAQLAAHCHVTPGLEQQVCCEEVTLTVRGRAADHLHSIIIPLLVPDLPVYVWWTGPLPRKRHALQEMLQTADHFIVDSARFASSAGLLEVARLCGPHPGYSIGDLNWERLAPWRDALVRQCRATSLREYLQEVSDVQITFAGGSGGQASSQALLLLGWLAWQGGWDIRLRPARGQRGNGLARRRQREVAVEVRPHGYAGLQEGWLASLGLRWPAGGHDASLSLSRIGDPLHLALRVGEPHGALEELVRMQSLDVADMLLEQLDAPQPNPDFTQAVMRAVPLIAAAAR